jgi:hypothetical protein
MSNGGGLQAFWAQILSEDSRQIITAYNQLDKNERKALLEHLRRMAEEEGWAQGQRRRARRALEELQESP